MTSRAAGTAAAERTVEMPTGEASHRAAGAPEPVRRIVVLGPSDLSLVRNRASLVAALVARRQTVLCVAPSFDTDRRRTLNLLGAETVAFDPPAGRFRALEPLKRLKALAALVADWRADVALAYGGRGLAEPALAARRARVPRVVSLVNAPLDDETGGGASFIAHRIAPSLARALAVSDAVVAHNAPLLRQAQSIAGAKSRAHWSLVPGAGVDLAHFAVAPLPPLDDGLVFLTITALEERRGVLELAEAARRIRAHGRRARFVLVATPGEAADRILRQDLAPFAGDLEILDPVDDVRPLLARCHVYLHPSRAEGMPRAVLEAMSVGRPIVTTDTPGCRDTVDERVNGCLVPPRDAGALTLAIESVLKRPDLIPSQARASRAKAERRFDVRDVNRALIAALGLD